ncbi:hypothetical protein AJY63_02555, partial [Campylobacter jejuni]|uniref:hypothetical protein n=1 Tax=Campylobacter jejuni TaxID=197 RepID=UPI000873FA8A
MENNKIDNALDYWNFELVEMIYDECIINNDDSIILEYCNFLYNTANFEKLVRLLKDNVTLIHIEKYRILHENYHLLNKCVESVFENIHFIPKDILCCYYFRKKINSTRLIHNPEKKLFLYKTYILDSNNTLTQNFSLWLLVKYFQNSVSSMRELFFIPKNIESIQYHIMTKLFYSDSQGAKNIYNIFIEQIHIALNNQIKINKIPKVAICFYGILRGDWQASLKHSFDNIATILKADCFLSTWEEKQEWPGFSGGNNWIERLFGVKYAGLDVNWLGEHNFFKTYLKNSYEVLECEYLSRIDLKLIKDMKKKYTCLKKIQLNNLEKFEANMLNESFFRQNTSKLYYGIYKAFELMKEYENEMRIKYDYVFILRADSEFFHIDQNILDVQLNEIADSFFSWGSGCGSSYGTREIMEIYASIYNFAEYIQHKYILNPWDNHDTIFKWMTLHGVKTIPLKFYAKLSNTKCLEGLKLPYFQDALQNDIDQLKKTNMLSSDKIVKIASFFNRIVCDYGEIKCRTRSVKRRFVVNAKSRIQNHLSYKLGQALIENSKSILGYIRIPFVLSYIKDKHKFEQKAYEEKIKENPNLALPPLETYPDYKEALKEKECFTYK